jgi:hypothetical protein
MNSLPFISHQLFVAAVKQEGRPRRKPSREMMSTRGSQAEATEVQLDLLTAAHAAPERVVRQLEAAPLLGGA